MIMHSMLVKNSPSGQELSNGVLLMDLIVGGKIMEHWANAVWVTVLIKLVIISPLPGD